MIRFISWILLSVCFCSLAVTASGAQPPTDHVFIISIDGGKPSVIQQARMPVLQKLAKAGAVSWTAQTIKPSLTLPSHTSMLTGVVPETHRMTWNGWVPSNGIVKIPTIFQTVKQAGISTAMFVGKEKFRHLLIPGTVDEFNYDHNNSVMVIKSDNGGPLKKAEACVAAQIVAKHAADYILAHKPGLCFIHFPDPDVVGHDRGWGSSEQIKAFADTDAALDILMNAIRKAGIAKRSVVMITADHGGHGKGHGAGTMEDVQIPWIAWGQGVKKHFEIAAPISTCDTAATALWLLGLAPTQKLDGVAVTSAFK